jgi:hypothetical protein
MDTDFFYALAEVAVALAGFSGIAVVLRQESPGSLPPFASRSLGLLIADCLIVVLFSFFPVVLHKAGWTPADIWTASNAAVGLIHLIVFGLLARGVLRGFTQIGQRWAPLSRGWKSGAVLITLVYLSELAIGICQLLAAMGQVFSSGEAIYAVGLLAFLFYAAVNFALLVAGRDAA